MTSTRVPVIPRKEFARDFGREYSAGQHVTFIGPTQRGKTTLCIDLLQEVERHNKIPIVILAGKPPGRDYTIENVAPEKLNLRTVDEWPPIRTYKDRKRNGYVLRPLDKAASRKEEEAKLRGEFEKAIMSNYQKKTPTITVADEAYLVQVTLKLKGEYEQPLMRGAPHAAMWSLIQRGAYVSYLSYNSPDHIFIFNDPDVANRKRYSEIGGVDPRFIYEVTNTLQTYEIESGQTISECLYIRRAGPQIMIVDVN